MSTTITTLCPRQRARRAAALPRLNRARCGSSRRPRRRPLRPAARSAVPRPVCSSTMRPWLGKSRRSWNVAGSHSRERFRALGAVQERLADLDPDGELRHLAVDGAVGEQRRRADDRRAAVDAQRVLEAGDEEQQADRRVGQQVAHGVDAVVARPVGDQKRRVVEDPDETPGVALRRDVGLARWRSSCRCTGTASAR